jgi:hypothetical protein
MSRPSLPLTPPVARRVVVRRAPVLVAAALALGGAAACAAGTRALRSPQPVADTRRATAGLIAGEELASAPPGTMLGDVVRARGAAFVRGGGGVSVFVNGAYAGSMATLREIPAREVQQVRVLTGPEATFAYGTLHAGAAVTVVEVTLRRPER